MKKISVVLGVLMMVVIGFSSCGSDDDNGAVGKPETEEFTYTYKIPIQGIADNKQNPPASTLEFKSLMGDKAATFVAGQFQRGKCSIKVEGLKDISETVVLKDFKINVGNRGWVSLGNCKTNGSVLTEFICDYEHTSDTYTNIVKYVFDDLVGSSKKSTVAIEFTPNETFITESSEVYLNIKVTGLMTYNIYPEN